MYLVLCGDLMVQSRSVRMQQLPYYYTVWRQKRHLMVLFYGFYRATACRVRYMQSPFRLFVTRVDQSKTVEVRMMQPSPQSSPMTLVS